MPTLYYVPMIHTPQELGGLKNAVLAAQRKISGKRGLNEFLQKVEHYWQQEVEQRIQHTELSQPEIASRLHIFVDGLPDTTETLIAKIVTELTSLQVPAYLIIKTLLDNGAVLHGTENAELLLQEYRYWTEISQGKKQNPEIAEKLLRDRDQYITQRIISVVPDEELALLFIGRNHDVIGKLRQLSSAFTVVYL